MVVTLPFDGEVRHVGVRVAVVAVAAVVVMMVVVVVAAVCKAE